MNWIRILVGISGIAALSFAETDFGSGELRFIEKLAASAKQDPSNFKIIAALEKIAEGKPEAIDSQLIAGATLGPGGVQTFALRRADVRAYALQSLGNTGLPSVLAYLSNLHEEDLGKDDTGSIWPSARSAAQRAAFLQITDPQMKIEFLEKAVEGSPGQGWALDELCDHGVLLSLPKIRESIRNRNPFQSGEEEATFCESRMAVITGNPDRAKALGSVLQVGDTRPSVRMIRWAVDKLDQFSTPEANQMLDVFAGQIRQLPVGSSAWQDLSWMPRMIEKLRTRER